MAAKQVFLLILSSVLAFHACISYAQLSPTFYATTCPTLATIVLNGMTSVFTSDPRIGASLLRLHFHDCFVNGCDASILLDNTANFTGEKSAGPNANSARGFEVIDSIKAQVETACPGIVSCADILTLATRDGVVLLGGPSWNVPLGRRDSLTASLSAANTDIPGPTSTLATLITMFGAKGLTAADLTVLSGAHSIGQAQCAFFRPHIYNDANVDPTFATLRKTNCPRMGGGRNLEPLDIQTPNRFDNAYYQNLLAKRVLFRSDQVLFDNNTQDSLVRTYSANNALFVSDFAAAMVKLSSISPLTGTQGQVRRNCRRIN